MVKAIRGRKAIKAHLESGGVVMLTRSQQGEKQEFFSDPISGATVSNRLVDKGLAEGWLAPRKDGLFEDSQTYGEPQ